MRLTLACNGAVVGAKVIVHRLTLANQIDIYTGTTLRAAAYARPELLRVLSEELMRG
jgi:hypothetical protein